MTEIEKHLDDYGKACNTLLKDFLDKHGWSINDGWWVGDKTGEVWGIDEEKVITMENIVVDLEENAPSESYGEWWEYCLRCHLLGIENTPNYRSWLHGCPRESEEYLSKLEKLKEDFEEQIRKCNEGKVQDYGRY